MRITKPNFALVLVLTLIISLFGVPQRPVHADVSSVLVATVEDNTKEGACSLRKAIMVINMGANPYPQCAMDATTKIILLPNEAVVLNVVNDINPVTDRIIESDQRGDLDIYKDVTIIGTGPESAVIWRGSRGSTTDRIFHIHSGAKVVMSDFKIAYGTTSPKDAKQIGGGIFNEYGILTLNNMHIENNSAISAGGGVFNQNGSTLWVNNSTFFSNISTKAGGAISNNGIATVETSLFDNNESVARTSAGFSNTAPNDILVIMNNSTFTNQLGNAIENSGSSTLALSFLTIENNKGNGLYLNGGANSWTMIRGSIIANSKDGSLIYPNCFNAAPADNFVDGGYNLVYSSSESGDGSNCVFSGTTTHASPALLELSFPVDPVQHTPALTAVFTFVQDSSVSPQMDAIKINTETSACNFDAVSGPLPIPSAPIYDQLGRSRPFGEGCDIGSYELGATQRVIYLPALHRFQ